MLVLLGHSIKEAYEFNNIISLYPRHSELLILQDLHILIQSLKVCFHKLENL